VQNTLWQTTIHQSLHTSVDIDGRCRTAADDKMNALTGSVFTASVVVADGSVVSLRSMRSIAFGLNGMGKLAGSAVRATIANPSSLEPTTARWSKDIAIAKPSGSDGSQYQDQYDATIEPLTNRIFDRWSHVPGPNRHRNRGAS
jgi:hypothetical protein